VDVNAIDRAGTYRLGHRSVHRLGYGAMQLAGPGVFGPPRDRAEAVAVLRAAVEAGIDHIDTCDYYGPHVTNEVIREALHPYPANLVIVTKVAARRGPNGEWLAWMKPAELTQAIHDNLRNLGLDQIEVVNFRSMHGLHAPEDGPIAEQVEKLAQLQEQGLIRHIGVSHVTRQQIAEARTICAVACVQNWYNLARRGDEAMIRELAADGIPYVPYFPLGGFSPLQSSTLDRVAGDLGATPMQVAIAWLLQRSPNMLLIPGTSSRGHLAENIAAAALELPAEALADLDAMAGETA
jgi:aryl-alcohol dehydrogenase-like predicted oxidoreductase